jgi:hypothetical protein
MRRRPVCDSRRPDSSATYCVLMDVNRWDTDEGRAWITVTASDPLDAMRQVRDKYPNAAVLRAEEA